MSLETNKLKLIKPAPGSINWGNAVNNNFEKIDNGYAKLSTNLHNIESRLKETGTFSFLFEIGADGNKIDIDYAQIVGGYILINNSYYQISQDPLKQDITINGIVYNNVSYFTSNQLSSTPTTTQPTALYNTSIGAATLGNLTAAGSVERFEPTTSSEYGSTYYNDNDLTKTQLYSLPDFTAFYIDLPYVLVDSTSKMPTTSTTNAELYSAKIYAFGIEWSPSEIMIKSSEIKNNQRTTLISKFKQVLGGYYVPSTSPADPNMLIFNKSASAAATSRVEVFVPRNVYNGSLVNKLINDTSLNNNTYTIDTECPLQVNVNIPKYQDNSTQPIYEKVSYSYNINDINFFITDVEISDANLTPSRQFIVLDYKLQYNNNSWKIIIDGQYIQDIISSDQKVYVSYFIASIAQPSGT